MNIEACIIRVARMAHSNQKHAGKRVGEPDNFDESGTPSESKLSEDFRDAPRLSKTASCL